MNKELRALSFWLSRSETLLRLVENKLGEIHKIADRTGFGSIQMYACYTNRSRPMTIATERIANHDYSILAYTVARLNAHHGAGRLIYARVRFSGT